ncbi:MAG: DMT family transporter [Reichenbachiella sp.]
MMQKSNQSLAWVLLILVSLIWGSSFILIKKGLLVFNAFEVGSLRIFVASIVLIPFGIKALFRVPKEKLPFIFIVGFVGSFIPSMLFAYAQTGLDSSMTGVFNSFTPIAVLVIGSIFFNLQIRKQNILGIMIGFSGCVLIILGGANFDLSGVNYFALYILAACVMYGTNVNIIKSKVPTLKALDITSVSFLLVAPFAGGFLLLGTDFVSKLSAEPATLTALGYICLLGIIGTALAMFIFNNLVKIASPVFASSCTYIIPLVAIAWGLMDGEQINIYQYLGIGIVLSGVYLANKK